MCTRQPYKKCGQAGHFNITLPDQFGQCGNQKLAKPKINLAEIKLNLTK